MTDGENFSGAFGDGSISDIDPGLVEHIDEFEKRLHWDEIKQLATAEGILLPEELETLCSNSREQQDDEGIVHVVIYRNNVPPDTSALFDSLYFAKASLADIDREPDERAFEIDQEDISTAEANIQTLWRLFEVKRQLDHMSEDSSLDIDILKAQTIALLEVEQPDPRIVLLAYQVLPGQTTVRDVDTQRALAKRKMEERAIEERLITSEMNELYSRATDQVISPEVLKRIFNLRENDRLRNDPDKKQEEVAKLESWLKSNGLFNPGYAALINFYL